MSTLGRLPHPATSDVVVDHATCLHGGVDGRRPNEAETRFPQVLRERDRLRRRGLPVGLGARPPVLGRPVSPEELVQRCRVTQRHGRGGVGDRRFDLAPVADNRGVAEQALDVALAEAGDAIGVEALERRAEALTLAQDRQPRQPRLEAFEAEPFVEAALVRDGAPPLFVVVGVVERVGRLPAANQDGQLSTTSTLTTPSSTVTG